MESNREDIDMLTQDLGKLADFFKTMQSSSLEDLDRVSPEALRKRMQEFDR